MVVNETRRRLLRQLNSRYIFGKYVCFALLPISAGGRGRGRWARDVVEGHWRSKQREKTSLAL